VKPNINSVEVRPQLSNSRHPVDGALVVVVHCGRKIVISLHYSVTDGTLPEPKVFV